MTTVINYTEQTQINSVESCLKNSRSISVSKAEFLKSRKINPYSRWIIGDY